jgi:hypothetical protein
MSLVMFMPLSLVNGAVRMHAVAARPTLAATSRAAVCMYWHIFPRDYSDSNWSDRTRTSQGTILTKEYNLEPGQQQTLGRYDLGEYADQSPNVDPEQCVIQVAEDGSCVYAYAQGTQPTGWRTRPDEPWNWMQPGESVVLESGHKVSLDCEYPEDAVYKCEKAGRFLVQEYLESQGLAQSQGGGQGQLPPGWVKEVDATSGQEYYYNEQSGQSSWEVPQF